MGGRGKNLSLTAKHAMEERIRAALFAELSDQGISFSRGKTKFITRDHDGKVTWLEMGNEKAGLTHILEKHADDFRKTMDLMPSQIPNHIRMVVERGEIVSSTLGKGGTRKVYKLDGHYYTVVVTGSNGYIVTAHPLSARRK